MEHSRACSEPQSDIVQLFLERSGVASSRRSPEEVMAELVEEALPPKRVRSQGQRVQHFLDARNVVSIEFVRDAGYDGMIEPIGSTFGDGFKMRLKASASEARARFTLAHEACHTFFYELAPEIKFRHHEEDNREESLCNFGAAVLLIPSAQLRARVKKLPVCLDSLDQMAEEYAVSLPTMLLRLRSLGLWRCQLSLWHRTVGGEFVLDRLYGGPKVEWKWHGPSALEHVWESSESALGTGFVYVTGRGGNQAYKPIVYHVRRSNTGVIVLWGDGIAPKVSACPLFEMARAA